MRKEVHMEKLIEYIKPELSVMIPVLYFIGLALKNSRIRDERIPYILTVIAVLLVSIYSLSTNVIEDYKDIFSCIFAAITQGIILAGLTVYSNQLYKQSNKLNH
ncbi:hypothetical protein DWZ33_03770 [Dielma fastidiosa]|nr:hypothetical protein DWZ33_03770 [Dielma fastidiosa]